jgi:hypothetical protein
MTDDRPLLEVPHAATILGVSIKMLHRLIENRIIRAGRTTKGFKVIDPADIDGLALTYEEVASLIQSKKTKSADRGKEQSHVAGTQQV